LWADGRSETRAVASTIPDEQVRCLAVTDGVVWVGTARGLAQSTDWIAFSALPAQGPRAEAKGDPASPLPSREGLGEGQDQEAIRPSPYPLPKGERGIRAGPADPAGGDQAVITETRSVSRGSGAGDAPVASPAVAIYGPRNPTMALPGYKPQREPGRGLPDLLAIQLAVERANAAGGLGGVPYDLVVSPPGYARYGWGLPEDDFASFASQDSVVGMVGKLTADDRVADAVVARTGIPLVNVSVQQSGGEATDNPWVFRCYGREPRRLRRLLDYALDEMGCTRPAAIRMPGRAAAVRAAWWSDHARQRGHPPVAEVEYDPAHGDLPKALEGLCRAKPDVVLAWADAAVSADIVRHLRKAGLTAVFVGGPLIVGEEFVGLAGAEAGPVLALPASDVPLGGEFDTAFAAAYAERNLVGGAPRPPTVEGHRSHEAADHLLAAIQRAGVNHRFVREGMAERPEADGGSPAQAAGPSRHAVRSALMEMANSASGEAHYELRHKQGIALIARLTEDGWVMQTID